MAVSLRSLEADVGREGCLTGCEISEIVTTLLLPGRIGRDF